MTISILDRFLNRTGDWVYAKNDVQDLTDIEDTADAAQTAANTAESTASQARTDVTNLSNRIGNTPRMPMPDQGLTVRATASGTINSLDVVYLVGLNTVATRSAATQVAYGVALSGAVNGAVVVLAVFGISRNVIIDATGALRAAGAPVYLNVSALTFDPDAEGANRRTVGHTVGDATTGGIYTVAFNFIDDESQSVSTRALSHGNRFQAIVNTGSTVTAGQLLQTVGDMSAVRSRTRTLDNNDPTNPVGIALTAGASGQQIEVQTYGPVVLPFAIPGAAAGDVLWPSGDTLVRGGPREIDMSRPVGRVLSTEAGDRDDRILAFVNFSAFIEGAQRLEDIQDRYILARTNEDVPQDAILTVTSDGRGELRVSPDAPSYSAELILGYAIEAAARGQLITYSDEAEGVFTLLNELSSTGRVNDPVYIRGDQFSLDPDSSTISCGVITEVIDAPANRYRIRVLFPPKQVGIPWVHGSLHESGRCGQTVARHQIVDIDSQGRFIPTASTVVPENPLSGYGLALNAGTAGQLITVLRRGIEGVVHGTGSAADGGAVWQGAGVPAIIERPDQTVARRVGRILSTTGTDGANVFYDFTKVDVDRRSTYLLEDQDRDIWNVRHILRFNNYCPVAWDTASGGAFENPDNEIFSRPVEPPSATGALARRPGTTLIGMHQTAVLASPSLSPPNPRTPILRRGIITVPFNVYGTTTDGRNDRLWVISPNFNVIAGRRVALVHGADTHILIEGDTINQFAANAVVFGWTLVSITGPHTLRGEVSVKLYVDFTIDGGKAILG